MSEQQITVETLENYIKAFSQQWGMDGFNCKIHNNYSKLYSYTLTFFLPLDFDFKEIEDIHRYGPSELADALFTKFEPILEKIKNSEVATSKYNKIEKELAAANARIKKLEPYEQYFKVQMLLNHGENNN